MGETTTKHIFTTWWVWLNSPLAPGWKNTFMWTHICTILLRIHYWESLEFAVSFYWFQFIVPNWLLLAGLFSPKHKHPTPSSPWKCDELLHCSDQELLRFHSNDLRFLIFRCNCGFKKKTRILIEGSHFIERISVGITRRPEVIRIPEHPVEDNKNAIRIN